MPRRIVKFGHPALRTPGKKIEKITPALRELAEEMITLMRKANGVGLAAQQVGEPIQLFVLEIPADEKRPSSMNTNGKSVDWLSLMPMTLINPEIELSKNKEKGEEGCLSFPDIHGDVIRSSWVTVKATDLEGQPLHFECSGLLARAVQHEFDHLRGVLFIDRLDSAAKMAIRRDIEYIKEKGERDARLNG